MDKEKQLDHLRKMMLKCSRCSVRKEASRVVLSEGNSSPIMFVDRNPGHTEDLEGRPFVGPGGKLLDKIIAGCNFERESVYITNLVKCYSRGDRPPNSQEIMKCMSWLLLEIKIVDPKLIVAFGNQVVRALLGADMLSVVEIHGNMYNTKLIPCPVFVMYHPGYVLRKKEIWGLVKKDIYQLKMAMSSVLDAIDG